MRLLCTMVLLLGLGLCQAVNGEEPTRFEVWIDLPPQGRTKAEAVDRVRTILQRLGGSDRQVFRTDWHTNFFQFRPELIAWAYFSLTATELQLHCISVQADSTPARDEVECLCEAIRAAYLHADF